MLEKTVKRILNADVYEAAVETPPSPAHAPFIPLEPLVAQPGGLGGLVAPLHAGCSSEWGWLGGPAGRGLDR